MSSRILILCLAALVATSCQPAKPTAKATVTEMRTVETVDPKPAVLQPPPVLTDEAPPPKPKLQPWETAPAVILTPDDEKVRASLPFAPAIAMDPVDGSKISIRANTPRLEAKNRIYYFSSEENKRAFAANPDQYTKSALTKL